MEYGIDILDRYVKKKHVRPILFYKNQGKILSHFLSASIITKAKYIDIKVEYTEDHDKRIFIKFSYQDFLENTILCQIFILCVHSLEKRESRYLEDIKSGKEWIEVSYDKNRTNLYVPKFTYDKETYFFFNDAVDAISKKEIDSMCNYKGAKFVKSKKFGPNEYVFNDYQKIFAVLTFPEKHSTFVVVIKGTLDCFAYEILKVIKRLVCIKKRHLVIDFKNVDYLGNSFIGSLQTIQSGVSNCTKIHLVNLKEEMREQLLKNGQDLLFNIDEIFDYDSIDLYY